MTRYPTTKALRIVYPRLPRGAAQLARNIMRAQVNPVDNPAQFPRTVELTQLGFVPTPLRLIRVLALAELFRVPLDDAPEAPILARYGVHQVQRPGDTGPVYWLHSAHNPDALTLCSVPPPAPPGRREVQRDPWLYQDPQTRESYRLAIPAQLLKQRNRGNRNG